MSYFIGFLIFVATFATANQAFAVDNPMLVHDAGVILSDIGFRILGLSFVIGMFLSNTIQSPELTNKISFRHTLLNMVIAGTLFAILTFFGLMVIAFVRVMLEVDIWHMIFNYLLGTENKHDSLIFIGTVMGGLLAAINATIIYFRFSSQERKNVLTEKGLIEDRFRFATRELVSKNSIMLISVFHQFYYLAKHHYVHDFRKNIFDVLCSYLHEINNRIGTHDWKGKPLDQYQKLLNVLFMTDDNSSIGIRTRLRLSKACPRLLVNINPLFPFAKFNTNLKNVSFLNSDLSNAYFARATFEKVDFEGANLEEADFRYAEFTNTNLKKAKNAKGANFYKATMNNKPIPPKELPPSYKKEHIPNFIFCITVIAVESFLGIFCWFSWEVPYWQKTCNAIVAVMLGLFPSAILGAYLGDLFIKWNSKKNKACRRLYKRKFKRFDKRHPLLSFLVFLVTTCVLMFCLALLYCLQADDVLMGREEYYTDWNPPPEKEES